MSRESEAVPVKEEPEWEGLCGVSEAAARAGLYADHEVKDELVLGPVLLQPADVAFAIQDALNTAQDHTSDQKPFATGFLPETIPRHYSSEDRAEKYKIPNKCVKTKIALKPCSVRLERIDENEISAPRTLKKSLHNFPSNRFSQTLVNEKRQSSVASDILTKQILTSQTDKKRLFCDICGKHFKNNCVLMIHQRIHTGYKPHPCDFCEKQFAQKGDLIAHTRTHTGQRPYLCENCGKRFAQKSDLTIHTRIHTDTKPYTCETCCRQFRHKSTLTVHVRTHKNEKPYCCDTCGKYFTQRSTLIRHTRIHTGQKPHSCDTCGRKFVQKSDLASHKLTHRRKKSRS